MWQKRPVHLMATSNQMKSQAGDRVTISPLWAFPDDLSSFYLAPPLECHSRSWNGAKPTASNVNNRDLLVIVVEARKSKIKVLADPLLGEDPHSCVFKW
jgi:hypothetical protein